MPSRSRQDLHSKSATCRRRRAATTGTSLLQLLDHGRAIGVARQAEQRRRHRRPRIDRLLDQHDREVFLLARLLIELIDDKSLSWQRRIEARVVALLALLDEDRLAVAAGPRREAHVDQAGAEQHVADVEL